MTMKDPAASTLLPSHTRRPQAKVDWQRKRRRATMMKARPRVQSRPIQSSSSSSVVPQSPVRHSSGLHFPFEGLKGATPERHHPTLPSSPLSSPSSRRKTVMLVLKFVLVFQLVVFFVTRWSSRQSSDDGLSNAVGGSLLGPAHYFTDEEEEQNSRSLQRLREHVAEECQSSSKGWRGATPQSKAAMQWRAKLDGASADAAAAGTRTSLSETMPTQGFGTDNATEKCRFTFFDFGANVGDSLGKFIAVGIPTCDDDLANSTGTDSDVSEPQPQPSRAASGASSFAGHTARNNRLVRWSKKIMYDLGQQLEGRSLQPEHYCYVGIEGNPVFTSRLHQLQHRIVRMQPRPVKWAHFYTETVGAISNDPTVLYLDTKNADKNYWGSSTLSTHRDVQASANAEGQVYQANVQGVTLTTLLKRHVLNEHGSHVLIKLDIEGSEYAVLNEAAESGILCELSSQAVQIDVMVEVHSKQVIGALDEMEYFRHAVKSNLERLCGVNLHLTMEAD